VPRRQTPETHPYFGTQFSVPDSHTFCRNPVSGGESGQNALKSAAEIERFSEHGELSSSSTLVLAAAKPNAPQSAGALATLCESATF